MLPFAATTASPSFASLSPPTFGGAGMSPMHASSPTFLAGAMKEAQSPKMDLSVVFFKPEDFQAAMAPGAGGGAKYFGSPSAQRAPLIPHELPLSEPEAQQFFSRRASDVGLQMLEEARPRWEEQDRRREAEWKQRLEQGFYGSTGIQAKVGLHALVLGRHVPHGRPSMPMTYAEMVRLPAGFVPGPPGFGYENYMRPPPPPQRQSVYPDHPIGAPMSHGNPAHIGRRWEDAAPNQSEFDPLPREPSTAQVRIRREPSMADLPDPKENMLNPHATVADREYEARVVFRKFDIDNSDYLDLDEFVRAMNYLGVELTYDDARPIYEMFDEDGSGQMDEEEFVRNYLNNYC